MNCINCGKELTQKQIQKAHFKKREPSFCSIVCSRSYIESTRESLFCKTCGKKLTQHQTTIAKCKKRKETFCSYECFKNRPQLKNYMILFCKSCGKKITRRQINKALHRSNRLPKYCSPKCASVVNSKIPWTQERKQKMSEMMSKREISEELRKRMSLGWTEESRMAVSLSSRKRIANNLLESGIAFPNFNKKACDYFKRFDEENNTKGQYATNGGEYLIKELGYWVDYINFDKKLIIEWDEESHYVSNKKIQHDLKRQTEIEKTLSDYKLVRIREKYKENYSINYERLLEENICHT